MKRKRIIALFLLSIFLVENLLVAPANAEVLVIAKRDDIYNKLEEAAKINTIVNTLLKCFKSYTYSTHKGEFGTMGSYSYGFVNSTVDYLDTLDMSDWTKNRKTNVYEGKIFTIRVGINNNTNISTALWLEKEIEQGEVWNQWGHTNEDDRKTGSIWCWYGQDLNHSIFQLFAKAIRTDLSREVNSEDYYRILCNGKSPRILRPAYLGYGMYATWEDKGDQWECGSRELHPKNTAYNYYILDDNWRDGLKQVYEDYRKASGNQYLPEWEHLGDFNNVDGYFNYIMDFNSHCGAELGKKDDEGVLPITTYEKEEEKIVAKTVYVKVTSGNGWDYPLSESNPVKTCKGLLERIEQLRVKYNGSANSIGDDRQYGYEGVILSKLNDACKNIVDTKTGENGWETLKKQLQEILNSDDATYSQKLQAEEDLDIIKTAEESGVYFTSKGEETDANGKAYTCIDVSSMEILIDDYHYGSEDLGEGDDDQLGDAEASCYDHAGVLGWILCPVIEAARKFIVVQYAAIVEPALQVDSSLFTADEENGTYKAWSVFRDIANVLFIVFFIFVIFSQVTGVGIDNYGIKKILPKLIVAIILINLSYVICQAAVDICNIVGSGIGGLFQRMAGKIPSSISVNNGTSITKTKISDWGDSYMSNFWGHSAIVTIILALGTGVVLSQGLAIIIPVFLLAISVAIMIIGLIVILGIRQAAAVLLVTVSPLAFVCYMLPNTKKIFDRWFKAFEGLLIAYPICSALVYGGDMASRILLNAADGNKTNAWLLISAAAVSIAPIFIIPKVIVKSVGAISAGVMGFSNRMSGRAKGAVGNRLEHSRLTDRRNYNQFMRRQKASARAGGYNAKRGRRIMRRYAEKGKNTANMSAAQRRKYNIAMGAVNAQNLELENAYRADLSSRTGDEITTRLMDAARAGKLDENMLVGSIGAFRNEHELTNALRQVSGTEAYHNLVHGNTQLIQRIGGAMLSREGGGVINQSIGKIMASGQDIRDDGGNWNADIIRKKVQGAGTDVMASQDKNVFNTEGAADLLSNSQLRAAAAAGYTGETAESFYGMMSGVSNERKQEIVSGMTAEQVASLTMQKSTNTGEEVGSLAAVGGAGMVTNNNQTAIDTINSKDGEKLRTRMDGGVMEALGITPGVSSNGSRDRQDEIGYWMYQENKSGHGNHRGDHASGGGLENGASITINHTRTTMPHLSNSHSRSTRTSGEDYSSYHPKKAGETDAAYNSRTRWENEMARRGEAAGPRRDDETHEEWQRRAGIESLESWQNNNPSNSADVPIPHNK